ncbi:hypothetical protein ACFXO9_31240 [Nocardia tengchongensis]|uniref:hypothetical protein n=1 Tax=Nocardia tengchongensis TaxID=2055889 RepID=UPI0036CC5B82
MLVVDGCGVGRVVQGDEVVCGYSVAGDLPACCSDVEVPEEVLAEGAAFFDVSEREQRSRSPPRSNATICGRRTRCSSHRCTAQAAQELVSKAGELKARAQHQMSILRAAEGQIEALEERVRALEERHTNPEERQATEQYLSAIQKGVTSPTNASACPTTPPTPESSPSAAPCTTCRT